jgi:phage antirepressor YoqD-like protein
MSDDLIKITRSKMNGGALAMSSREIAELTGSTHDNVLKTVRGLLAKGIVFPNETPYVHPQNGQTYTEFSLNYRDTMVVVSGYSAEMRARIIDRWQELEAKATAPTFQIPQSLPEALRLAADLADENAALKIESEAMRADVDALATIAKADGSLCMTDAAKALQHRPKDLIAFLSNNKWIYRRAGADHWVGYQTRTQAGDLMHKVTTVLRADGSEKITEQVRITPQGLAKLAKLFPPNVREVAA